MLKAMSRGKYDKFVKTLPGNVCLFCEFKKYQIIIHEWKYWILVQPISPYFKHHSMLCTKRHVKYFSDLNAGERREFFKADKSVNNAYKALEVSRLRMQLHMRYKNSGKRKRKIDPNEHLHIHYYPFKDGDFRSLVSKTAYRQNMVKLLKPHIKNF